MDNPVTERRCEPRLPALALQIDRATLRPGCPVDLVDLSANGAQVESSTALRPGSRIHIRLTASNRTLAAAAVVVRCSVWTLDPEAITYRAALRFEEECRSFWEEQARLG